MIRRIFLAVSIALCLSSAAIAQTGDSFGPDRGMSKAAVERSFGAPDMKRAAIGDPPISRWVYDGFTVYFEYDRVIHAVRNR